jgi:protein-S-isoprenylcysteine O-methyltransferase Ste14
MKIIGALWIAWLIYWIASAWAVKEDRRKEAPASRLIHDAAMLAGAVLLGVPHLLGRMLELRFHHHSLAWFAVGTALVILGLGFSVLARIWLGRNWSGSVTVKRDHQLIRSGPYALVRHPIYTGMLTALFGTALAIGNGRAALGFAVLLAGLIYKIGIEERFMAEEFGEAYAHYRREVPALIPFVL